MELSVAEVIGKSEDVKSYRGAARGREQSGRSEPAEEPELPEELLGGLKLPRVPELSGVLKLLDCWKFSRVPELPRVPELLELPKIPELPRVPELSGVAVRSKIFDKNIR